MCSPTGKIPVVFGVMTIGKPGVDGVRVTDLSEANKMLDVFQAHQHNEIDTARLYGRGSSEEYMAAAKWRHRKLVMGTKLYPNKNSPSTVGGERYSLEAADVRRGLLNSLKALDTDKIDLFYLHGPDRKTPLEETLREVNQLHQEGRFCRFGISNYMSWEVAAICEICDRHNWIKPVVYQGVYNTLHRAVEPELIPCIRKYGIVLYAFQPLAGDFLTSRYRRNMAEDDYESGSRFDPKKFQGKLHHTPYVNDLYFDALEDIRAAASKHSLTEAECALRWLLHHSVLDAALGDKIIIGASRAAQLEENLVHLEKGPLPDDVVTAMENAYLRVKGVVPKYFH